MPPPVGTERLVKRSTPKQIEPDGGADNVGDAVEGADLMKVDFFQRHTVDCRLRLGSRRKMPQGQFELPAGQLACAQDRLDVGKSAVFVFHRRFDADIGGREAAFADFFDLQMDRQLPAIDAGQDRLEGHAGVDQSGDGSYRR